MGSQKFHRPVLLKETLSHLFTDPDGIYLDGTIGYGGHSEKLLSKLSNKGRLIGIDLDPYALEHTKKRLSASQNFYSLHNTNFREYPFLLQTLGIDKLTGILFDLGTSSSQINSEHRGFSFQKNGPLDMRLNPNAGYSACSFLNNANESEISKVLLEYGEERHHKKIAKMIFKACQRNCMKTTFDLKHAIEKCVHPRFLTKSLARVFQSIRIKINGELDSLKNALQSSKELLMIGGRIAVISFHSLEDRIVKQFFKECMLECSCPKDYPICKCDIMPSLKVIQRKAIIPSQEELEKNPRSRSAKLRVAEKV